jgi:Ca2+-binding RTX toxin-like protein
MGAVLAVSLPSSQPATAQHGASNGHLPPVQKNVALIGKLDLFKNEEQPGRIADVAAFGDYAYLGAFASPNCENPGVYIIDISNPSNPKEADFIPTSDPSSFVGEGVQVLNMNTQFYKGPLLLYSQETCAPQGGAILGPDPRVGQGGPGGATLVDVRDPLNWRKLADHVGDNDPPPPGGVPSGFPHNSHSVFGWQQGEKAYMVVMDNGETTDIDVFDITNPSAPVFVLETGFDDFPEITENPPPNGASPFIHDFVVKKVGDKYLFLGSYWDGGYIILDFTDLANKKATFLRDTDFGPSEPLSAELRLPANTPPEGNAHQAEFNFDSSMFIGTDEDFNPYRFLGTITSGTFAGDGFTGSEGNATPGIDSETGLSGPTEYVGFGCPAPPAPSPNHVALAERGSPVPNSCTFTAKVQAAQAAGYKAIIIFNDRTTDAPNCDALVNMLAVGNIPSLFVGRSTGLKLLNTDPGANSCDTPTPNVPVGTDGQSFNITTLFDGWGYMHLYDANTMQAIDHFAIPESLNETLALDYGDLTVHEVAMDPNRNRAYVSYYAGGLRVFDFSREGGLQEVGAFIDQGGNNFWGVEVHAMGGGIGQVILASDRDAGLYIFKIGADVPRCGGKQTTILGTPSRDSLRGTAAADVIAGGNKRDTLRGRGGADVLCGEGAKDRLVGGKKRDVLVGGPGADILVGGPGKGDVCRGGKGRDQLRGCEKGRG